MKVATKKAVKKPQSKRVSAELKKRLTACFLCRIFMRLPIRQAVALDTLRIIDQLSPAMAREIIDGNEQIIGILNELISTLHRIGVGNNQG
jgi:hypothetical protein